MSKNELVEQAPDLDEQDEELLDKIWDKVNEESEE